MSSKQNSEAHDLPDEKREYRPYDVIRVLGIKRPVYADMKKRMRGVPKGSSYTEGDLLAFRVLHFLWQAWHISMRDLNKNDLSVVFETCGYPIKLLDSLVLVLYMPEGSKEQHLFFIDESNEILDAMRPHEKRPVYMKDMIKRHYLALTPESKIAETNSEENRASLDELLQANISSVEELIFNAKNDLLSMMQ